jgi:HEPN domain-containing protein
MKSVVGDWLRSASADLETIDAIIDNANLTTIISFHSQQCVEECLKALAEEFEIDTPRTHNLLTLKAITESSHPIHRFFMLISDFRLPTSGFPRIVWGAKRTDA